MRMKKQHGIVFLISCVLTGLMCSPAWADKIRPLNLEHIIERAAIIFEGECIDQRTGRDPKSGMLATWYTFRVHQGIKGKLEETFELKQYGGSDGALSVRSPNVHYQPGEKVVLFLYGKSRLGFSSVIGLKQGKFTIHEVPETKTKYVTNGMPALMLYQDMNLQPKTLTLKGLAAQGAERLQSGRLALKDFLTHVQHIVDSQEKNKKQKEQ